MRNRRHVMIGDIHGELDGLHEILKQAGLIDRTDAWIGGEAILVQTGDVIDRGPDSMGCVALLRDLQRQAPAAGGRVVRLLGNHELMVLQDEAWQMDYSDPWKLARSFRREIVRGDLCAAFSDGNRLITHAGLDPRLQIELEREMGFDGECGTADRLAEILNTILIRAAKADDFGGHGIFDIGQDRGGWAEVGGVFWNDFSSFARSATSRDLPQIFGHSTTGWPGVATAGTGRLIDIDAGLYEGFGGYRLYLDIDELGSIEEVALRYGTWERTNIAKGADDCHSLTCAGE